SAWDNSGAEKPQLPKITSESVTPLKSAFVFSINSLRYALGEIAGQQWDYQYNSAPTLCSLPNIMGSSRFTKYVHGHEWAAAAVPAAKNRAQMSKKRVSPIQMSKKTVSLSPWTRMSKR
ncbi:MAG TPA: hypothetical protein VII24_02090, partial [Pseudolabrys sp.]